MTASASTTRERSGPFWDAVEGRSPRPPAAATLGFELIDADVENGTIEVAFAATEDFLRPAVPGRIVGRGRVVHRDGDLAFVEGALSNSEDEVVATATSTIRVIPLR